MPFGVHVLKSDLNLRGIGVASVTLALVLSALTLAWMVSGQDEPQTSVPRAEATGAPMADVPGDDVTGLPRYPGSARIEYRRELTEGLAMTRVRYAVAAELDAVREFYRQVFRAEGWSEVDVRFSPGRWAFLVVSGQREARIRIVSRGAVVEISMGLSEPMVPAARSTLTIPVTASLVLTRPWAGRSGSRRHGPS